MIKIEKSKTIPDSLQGVVSPTSAGMINHNLYKSADVKQQLINDQHGKCAYCECLLQGKYDLDVEHFRPKVSYQEQRGSRKKTGYYWLAYQWSNLLASCNNCNRTYKNDLFPLIDERKRNIANQDITNEQPLFINPSEEDPKMFLTNKCHMIVPVLHDGIEDVRGRYVIDTFQLNDREPMLSMRKKMWDDYQCIIKQINLANQLILCYENDHQAQVYAKELLDNGIKLLRNITSDDVPFSGFLPR